MSLTHCGMALQRKHRVKGGKPITSLNRWRTDGGPWGNPAFGPSGRLADAKAQTLDTYSDNHSGAGLGKTARTFSPSTHPP